MRKVKIVLIIILIVLFYINSKAQEYLPVVPDSLRGAIDQEREGQHDANNIRTKFFNFGMVGDYPRDPINVDVTVFHSMEWPKGSGENYSDGHTPFVLAKVKQNNGTDAYIMETGYRERQARSPFHPERVMRFEPRPGYFQPDPAINKGRSVAISNDPRTWPGQWIDKLNDPDDPGWSGFWNGYFGKAPGADQESFVVYDDNFYDAWNFYPDDRDHTRHGLGLKIEQRGFQWANPQAGNVIFWHYDITNEGTTTYDNNIIFGLYMDSGVGGSGIGVDGIPESDDDNAFFDKSIGLNIVYTWDKFGHGMRGPTGYLGYSYMETPGNPFNGIDDDMNGVTDEKRDGGPGIKIEGVDNILAYVRQHYDIDKFEEFFQGSIENRPAVQSGVWWTGDEDMDWVAEFHDTGADGVFATKDNPPDEGEKDGIPTLGEPNFDKTDIDESDQIGLTGFKMNRIKAGAGSPSTEVDNIVFFMDENKWPQRLFDMFTSDDPFDAPLVLNYNIGFLFASGPFILQPAKKERFSLAQGFGANLRELENTARVVTQIYKANYQFAVPPPLPTVHATAGDGYVILTWDDLAERAFDPITLKNDFEGYKIYRSTDPSFLDPKIIYTATGSHTFGNGKPLAQFDLVDGIYGFSNTTVEGISYFLGNETGIKHTFTDSTVTNGQLYYYAVTAYDTGSDSLKIFPSENSISVSQTLRGGIILPGNVVQVRPNPPVTGFQQAKAINVQHVKGNGVGNIKLEVKNSDIVPDGHNFRITFVTSDDSVRAEKYKLIDETSGDTLIEFGTDLDGLGVGPVGAGILPVISTPHEVTIDSNKTGFTENSQTNIKLSVRYVNSQNTLPPNLKRPGYPENIEIRFSNSIVDTSLPYSIFPAVPVKFKVYAITSNGDMEMKFRFQDRDGDNTLSDPKDVLEIVTYARTGPDKPKVTWSIKIDTTGQSQSGDILLPGEGDVFLLAVNKPFGEEDEFVFSTIGQRVDNNLSANSDKHPYVVPNPYVGAASFEPQRFAVSGRGERRMEFRNIPVNATIRIYTVNGELVKTLQHEGNITEGYVAWNLRTKDNLEVAPGLYIFHVEAPGNKPFVGKFAIIK